MKKIIFSFLFIFSPCAFTFPLINPPDIKNPAESFLDGYMAGKKIREDAAAVEMMQQQQLTDAAMSCRYAYNDYLKHVGNIDTQRVMTLDEYCQGS